jgi:hypothetical protein
MEAVPSATMKLWDPHANTNAESIQLCAWETAAGQNRICFQFGNGHFDIGCRSSDGSDEVAAGFIESGKTV